MKYLTILFLLFFKTNDSNAVVSDSTKLFTITELKEDYQIFREALTDAHPAAFRYISKEKLNQFYDSIQASIIHSMTDEEFTRILMLSINKIRCVHTHAYFPKMYQVNPEIKERTLLPLIFKFIDKEAYVSNNKSPDSSTINIIGQKVISINGRSIKEYVDMFYPLMEGDGYIETSRYDQLGGKLKDYISIFIERPDTFIIETIKPLTKAIKTFKVPAMSINEYIQSWKKNNVGKNYRLFDFKILNSETAFIRMDNFYLPVLKRNKLKYKNFLKTSFSEIKKQKIKYLVLDIRNNGGGHPQVGATLFSYIARKSFVPEISNSIKYIKFDKEYMKYQDSPKTIKMSKLFATKTDSGYYTLNHFFKKLHKPWKPKRPSFDGSVYLLAGGSTYSAASGFAGIFNAEQRGPIIGRETGGYSYGPTGYRAIDLILPHSKATIHIPLIIARHNVQTYTFGRGIMPTYEIDDNERIKALIDGSDPELDYALKLIANKK